MVSRIRGKLDSNIPRFKTVISQDSREVTVSKKDLSTVRASSKMTTEICSLDLTAWNSSVAVIRVVSVA